MGCQLRSVKVSYPTAANLGHQREPGDLQTTGPWGQSLMQLLGAPECYPWVVTHLFSCLCRSAEAPPWRARLSEPSADTWASPTETAAFMEVLPSKLWLIDQRLD